MNNDAIVQEFKGYSTFVEIESTTMRSYNQWTVLNNMKENKLFQLMEEYVNNLPKSDQFALLITSEYIKAKGLEEVKRELTLAAA